MEKFLYQYLEYLVHFKCPLPPTSTIIQEKQSDDSEETVQWTSDLSDTESSADSTHSDDGKKKDVLSQMPISPRY